MQRPQFSKSFVGWLEPGQKYDDGDDDDDDEDDEQDHIVQDNVEESAAGSEVPRRVP